ncbi:Sec-independent protein translocase subunit TatC, partial [Paraburkholderia sp. SIMBA_030]
QLILALPLIILYEAGIIAARVFIGTGEKKATDESEATS